MKPVGCLKPLAYGLLISAGVLVAEARTLINPAIVRDVQGSASYSVNGGRTWNPARTGHVYDQGTLVRTAPESILDLDLRQNGPAVRLTPETVLGLDVLRMTRMELDTIIETELDLRAGRIQGIVRRLAPGSRYEVKTPRGVAGISAIDEPTQYEISADGVVHVIEGEVVMVYFDPRDPGLAPEVVRVGAGETASPPVTPGERPVLSPTPEGVVADGRAFESIVADYQTRPFAPIPFDSPLPSHLPRDPDPTAPVISPVVVPVPEAFVSPLHGITAP